MKTKTMSLILTITLLGFGVGFFQPEGVLAGTSSRRQLHGITREFRSIPNAAEQKSIYLWIGEARNYSDQINFSISLENDIVTITLISDDEEVATWLQERFTIGQDSFAGEIPDGRIISRLDYDVSAIANGVTITISSDDAGFIRTLYGKIKQTK